MALEIVFTQAQHDKLKRLRKEQGLTWATISQRLNMSHERVIKEAVAIGLIEPGERRTRRNGGAGALEDALRESAEAAEDEEPVERVDRRHAMRAGHPVAMDVLLNAPRLEDRWKDKE